MPGFFTREELVGGAKPVRRATLLLFAIESRTADLVAQAHRDSALYLTLAGAPTPAHDLFAALAQGREAASTVTIQQLERFAAQWAALLPETPDPRLSAALAQLLGAKYQFTRAQTPRLRAALQLDTPATAQAFAGAYSKPLDSIYAPQLTARDRVRFAWSAWSARIENLPPFWLAFLLTVPVGPGLLAVPIALANIGPMPGVALLLIFGMVNALTAGALGETVARSGTMRLGLGFLGQLVADYLGSAGSAFLSLMLGINNFLVLIVFYLGIAGTLANATGLPAALWIAAVFAVGLYFLTRKTLNTTIAFALVVVLINLTLLIVIPLPALGALRLENLRYSNVPLLNGQSFDPAVLQLVLGIMLTNYFSHLLVANYGRVVLRRAPDARAWILGSMASIAATTLISCYWIIAINGAIDAPTLAKSAGTVLVPLAERVGPLVQVLGSLLVILGLGIATIHISLGTYYLIQERLPAATPSRARTLVSIAPVVGVFLLAEWLALTGAGSFAGLLGFTGVISLPLLGGIFPVLLLAASRRKGDFVPGVVYRWLGHPFTLTVLYVLFAGSIFIYGLFIYQSPVERVLLIVVGLLVMGMTGVMLLRGALVSRVVVQLHDDGAGTQSAFSIVASGKPLEARVVVNGAAAHSESGRLAPLKTLRSLVFELPAARARQLKVWVYQVSPEGNVKAVRARACIASDQGARDVDLDAAAGVVMPITAAPVRVEIAIAPSDSAQ